MLAKSAIQFVRTKTAMMIEITGRADVAPGRAKTYANATELGSESTLENSETEKAGEM